MNYGVQEKYPKSGTWRTLLRCQSKHSCVKRARKLFRKHPLHTFRVVSF